MGDVADLAYRLVVLTHGDNRDLLDATLASFDERVTPEPVERHCFMDGVAWSPVSYSDRRWTVHRWETEEPRGFCEATRKCWEIGSQPGVDFVFHLEHDFVFERDVDLSALAEVLDSQPRLAQMALMRGPVSPAEREAGGLFELRRGEYEGHLKGKDKEPLYPWLEHHSYFTTNVNLMRRQFMVENPWPDYPERCEGLFSRDLLERGYSFGAWGAGEVWVEHVGKRTGHGY